jgi:hypothetical protein
MTLDSSTIDSLTQSVRKEINLRDGQELNLLHDCCLCISSRFDGCKITCGLSKHYMNDFSIERRFKTRISKIQSKGSEGEGDGEEGEGLTYCSCVSSSTSLKKVLKLSKLDLAVLVKINFLNGLLHTRIRKVLTQSFKDFLEFSSINTTYNVHTVEDATSSVKLKR